MEVGAPACGIEFAASAKALTPRHDDLEAGIWARDVRPNDMKLWILDERLAYHYYLASDKKFSQVDAIEVDNERRVDLLIFNNPFAFAELSAPTYGSIVIAEVKRPERDD